MENLIISLTVFWLYFIYTVYRFGVLSSISATVDKLKSPILFSMFEWGISIPIIYYAYNNDMFLLAISGLLIMGVGFFPALKKTKTKKQEALHVFCATVGIFLAYAGLAIESIEWKLFYKSMFFWALILYLILFVAYIPINGIKKGLKNHTTWIEFYAFNIIILTLIMYERFN